MRALSLKEVSFTLQGRERRSLDEVDLEVDSGEFVALLGRNGSGKTTLSMLTNGLIPHSVKGTLEGTVEVFGNNTAKHTVAQLSTLVGMVFQEPENQLFCMSVEEEVAFGPENVAIPRDEIVSRVAWALETVGLSGYDRRSPFTLSGGEMQRLAIAAAISMRPRMIVLDEPAYALDPVGRQELYSLLRLLRDRHRMTVLVAERDPGEIAQYCDRMVLMSEGRIVMDAPPAEVLARDEVFEPNGLAQPQLSRLSSLMRSELSLSGTSLLSVDDAERAIVSWLASKRAGGDQA